jgi:hypothetical protein
MPEVWRRVQRRSTRLLGDAPEQGVYVLRDQLPTRAQSDALRSGERMSDYRLDLLPIPGAGNERILSVDEIMR